MVHARHCERGVGKREHVKLQSRSLQCRPSCKTEILTRLKVDLLAAKEQRKEEQELCGTTGRKYKIKTLAQDERMRAAVKLGGNSKMG